MTEDISVKGASSKKHLCADCQFCQWCGDDRCRVCQGEYTDGRGCRTRKLSFAEQIEAYEKLNQQKKETKE